MYSGQKSSTNFTLAFESIVHYTIHTVYSVFFKLNYPGGIKVPSEIAESLLQIAISYFFF